MTIGSALGAEDLADFAVDPGGFPGRIVNQREPLLALIVEMGMAQQIRGLHNVLNRVAQVMSQAAQIGDGFSRWVSRVVFHGGAPNQQFSASKTLAQTAGGRFTMAVSAMECSHSGQQLRHRP